MLPTAQRPKIEARSPFGLAGPEDIGAVTDDTWTLDKKMRMTDLSIAVGTLTAH